MLHGASSDCADLLYATGFMAPDPFIYFEADGQRGMVVSALEFARARSEAKKGVEVFEAGDFAGDERGGGDRTRLALKGISASYGVGLWEVPDAFPLGLADFLRSEGLQVKSLGGVDFFPRRIRKTAAEIKLVTRAQRVAEKGMKAAETMLAESSVDSQGRLVWGRETLTSEMVKRKISLACVMADAIASGTIVACGRHGSEPHNTGNGPILAGQPVVVDIFPRLENGGYWGDITRTFVKGKAAATVQRAYAAVREARDEAKRRVKAGAIPSELHAQALASLAARGFRTERRDGVFTGFFHGLGHGLGLEIHEDPRLGSHSQRPLEAGEVVTVEPGVYYPDWGGVRLEDVVVVRADGAELITDYPDVLEVP